MRRVLQLPDHAAPTRRATLAQPTDLRSRHAPDRAVIELNDIYQRLAAYSAHEQLAAHYRSAQRQGASLGDGSDPLPARPISMIATAIPPAATVSVAIHVLHALPGTAGSRLTDQLLETTERNAADALNRCQRALELDGTAHGYKVAEWLPVVFDIASPLLQSACPDAKPPTAVGAAQEAISWLSRALVELDEDSSEVPSALAEALARLLTVWVFTALTRDGSASA